MVEGQNVARGQVSGRTSQNKTLNFTTTQPILPAPGSYRLVRVTQSHPNSLVGEQVELEVAAPSLTVPLDQAEILQ
jgi:tRNA-2-methylthio-N6-dimethylallyladenosine synthase